MTHPEPFTDLQPPHSLEAESDALGGALMSRSAVDVLVSICSERDFYPLAHQEIFGAIQWLHGRDEPVDPDTVVQVLRDRGRLDRCGGAVYVYRLAEQVPTAAHTDHYARVVAEKATLRRLIEAAARISKAAQEGQEPAERICSRAEQWLDEASAARRTGELVSQRSVVLESLERWESREPRTGVPTGLYSLEEATCGWQDTDLIILAARPSVGKTAFMLHLARSAAAESKAGVLIFSLEMSRQQLTERQVSHFARVDSRRLRKSWELTDPEQVRVVRAGSKLGELPITICDQTDLGMDSIRALARQWRRQTSGQAVILVDYLQRVRWPPHAQNENNALEWITEQAKSMARELRLPVILLSQLSRNSERREDKRPTLADLRGSGGIEQAGDLVMFLYREAAHRKKGEDGQPQPIRWPQTVELIIDKFRGGEPTTLFFDFDGRFGDFCEVETRYSEADVPPEHLRYPDEDE